MSPRQRARILALRSLERRLVAMDLITRDIDALARELEALDRPIPFVPASRMCPMGHKGQAAQ